MKRIFAVLVFVLGTLVSASGFAQSIGPDGRVLPAYSGRSGLPPSVTPPPVVTPPPPTLPAPASAPATSPHPSTLAANTYKHAAQYKVATLDTTLRVVTGSDVTLAKTSTDAKLGPGGQGIHLLFTDTGNYRVEAPINKGLSFTSALATGMANTNRPSWAQEQANTIHNKWFLDKVAPGTKVLFASECAAPNKKHPNDTVRCTFYFPDPDSTSHEYTTMGDFTPLIAGDGGNIQKVSNTLCGTGKLNPDVEAQVCGITK